MHTLPMTLLLHKHMFKRHKIRHTNFRHIEDPIAARPKMCTISTHILHAAYSNLGGIPNALKIDEPGTTHYKMVYHYV